MSAKWLPGLFVLFFLSVISGYGAFYGCDGQDILAPDGSPCVIKGVALSFLLNPEAYALDLNEVHGRHLNNPTSIRERIRDIIGNDTDTDAFWDAYESNFYSDADFQMFAAEGFNTVRIPFNYRLISPQDTPGVYSEAGFEKLDALINKCAANGLGVILDMHSCPGGQSADGPADPEQTFWNYDNDRQDWYEAGVACLWEFNQDYYNATGRDPAFNKQRTADIWQQIATRYATNETVIGYELVNEPFLPYGVHYPDLRALMIQITDSIRAVDTNHILFVEGNRYAGSVDFFAPAWDDNLVLCFHTYWKSTTYETIQTFVETAQSNNIPLCVTETGENSNPWFAEYSALLESYGIGWCWWGIKKVESISSAFSADITPDYRYVIDNFRDSYPDPVQAKNGLMQLAANLASDQCAFEPGWMASIANDDFDSQPVPFAIHNLPGTIYCVDYDIGSQGVAYWDADYKNESEWWGGASGNNGGTYRNDGVDINPTADGNGYKVSWTADGEWLKYTVNFDSSRNYRVTFRTAAPYAGQLQLYLDGQPLTGVISLKATADWETWRNKTIRNIYCPAGEHILELRVITGGFDISSINFR